jgi:hypothetical protein
MWIFKEADFDLFRQRLQTSDLSFCTTEPDLNKACEKWTNLFLETASATIPNKYAAIRPLDKPWYNGNLRKLLRKKKSFA